MGNFISRAWDDWTGVTATEATNAANTAEAQKDRDYQSSEAQANRQFQMNMSSTAIQRRLADAKKAGVNPLLAIRGEASTPSGSAGHGSRATLQSPPGIMSGVSSAIELAKAGTEINNLLKTGRLLDAQTAKTAADAAKRGATVPVWKSFGTALDKLISKPEKTTIGEINPNANVRVERAVKWANDKIKKLVPNAKVGSQLRGRNRVRR